MSYYFPTREECGRHTIFPGVNILTCAAQNMMISLVELAPHSAVPEHSHPHEQVGMVLEGQLVFTIESEERMLQAGDLYRIPGQVRHSVTVLDQPAKAIDVFYPIREEYR